MNSSYIAIYSLNVIGIYVVEIISHSRNAIPENTDNNQANKGKKLVAYIFLLPQLPKHARSHPYERSSNE
jgi:hypothetical protein